MASLLLELFSEEIPARMQRPAAAHLKRLVEARLSEAGLFGAGPPETAQPEAAQPEAGQSEAGQLGMAGRVAAGKAFVTPRRLTLTIEGLPGIQPDRREEKKGPRTNAPEKALHGFMKANRLDSLEMCDTREDARGAYYVVVHEEKGRPTADLIARIIPEVIEKFPWQKSMRWGAHRLRWVRPLTSILCVFDGEVVPFSVAGIASADETQGHRFLGPEVIKARDFQGYAAALLRQKVILSTEDRAQRIHQDAVTLCEAQGLKLVEDDGLLAEVAGLSEWPIAMMGSFDEKFLALPDEVLIASMKGHQKYFSVHDPKTDRLANRFVFVANIEAPDGGAAMRRGYERVLAARLSDAWFLYQQDLKTPLQAHSEKLDTVTFFKGLGSEGDKMRRVTERVRDIAPRVGADMEAVTLAARLAKADLVTDMVGEFASLQGIMGRYYAQNEGLPPAVCDALKDHYRPAGQHDGVPTAPVSVALALADKLETLVSFWSIDETPSGSRDPFALRRAATGVVRLILENDVRLALPSGALRGFLFDRLKGLLEADGFAPGHIDAVARDRDGALRGDFIEIRERVAAVSAFARSSDGQGVLQAVKRATNILKAEEKKTDGGRSQVCDQSLLQEPAEQALFVIMSDVKKKSQDFVFNKEFQNALNALIPLGGPLDRFFDDVTVNADEPGLRENRLALLGSVENTCRELAEFSRIDG